MPRLPNIPVLDFKEEYRKNMYIELFDLLLDILIQEEVYEIENNKRQEEMMKIDKTPEEEEMDRMLNEFSKML